MWTGSWRRSAVSVRLMSNGEQISFEEYLAEYGTLTYKNKGISMMPLLREDKELFTVEKKGSERCRRYDVVLYKDRQDRYILHRVIRVLPDGYVIRGDNTYKNEFRTDDEIIGVMTGLIRDGREIRVTDTAYRVYSVLRTAGYPLRYVCFRIRHVAGRLLKLKK